VSVKFLARGRAAGRGPTGPHRAGLRRRRGRPRGRQAA
jgi:hypothetical protein